MSYDVVALVSGRPDERAIVDALRNVDPELRLHWHGDTEVLQVRDESGRLLATLEPGREVERTDDVVRLLDENVVAGLPDSFWWMETRARPDEQGREVAHRFADRLALRLGGAVWTSGAARRSCAPCACSKLPAATPSAATRTVERSTRSTP